MNILSKYVENKSPQTIAGGGFCRKFEITTNQITMSNLQNSPQEEWKPVLGYEGFYEVSSIGRVRSLRNKRSKKSKVNSKPARIKKQFINKHGYWITSISRNKVNKTITVHRLVALAFLPNPENKPQINHKNGVKTDNRVENLEWCTNSENMRHSYDTGLQTARMGQDCPRAKLTNKQAIEIYELRKQGWMLKDIAEKYSVDFSHVGKMMKESAIIREYLKSKTS